MRSSPRSLAILFALCALWITRCSGSGDAPDTNAGDNDAGADTRSVLSWPDMTRDRVGPDMRLDINQDSWGLDTIHDALSPETSFGDLRTDGQLPAGPYLICDPAGAELCANSADCQLLETPAEQAGITAKSSACVLSCVAEVNPAACALMCMSNPLTGAGLSSVCAECYVANEICILTNCLTHCVPDPHTENCLRCQNNEPVIPANSFGVDCSGDFTSCSGLHVARCAYSQPGACTGASDCTSLSTEPQLDVVKNRVAACTLGCLTQADPEQCILACTNDPFTGTGLSTPCNECYGDEALCMFINCIAHCVPVSTTATCLRCLNNELVTPPNTGSVDCLGDFTGCSGLNWQ